jgi:hypothetical protein
VKDRCNVPACTSARKGLGLCRRHYDMARKCILNGWKNPFKAYTVRTRGEYVKHGSQRIALARCRCGELHVKELGCAACRVEMRGWFSKRARKEALLQMNGKEDA